MEKKTGEKRKKPGRNVTSVRLRNDQIALMSLMPGEDGKQMTHAAIAEKYNLTRSAVSIILKGDEAMDLIEQAREKLRTFLINSIEGELDLMSQLAVKKIRTTLEAEISAIHKAKPNQDRAAFRLLEGRGFLRAEADNGEAGGLKVSPDQFGKLLGALERSDRVKEINPFDTCTTADADYEIIPKAGAAPAAHMSVPKPTQRALPESTQMAALPPPVGRVNVRVEGATGTDG